MSNQMSGGQWLHHPAVVTYKCSTSSLFVIFDNRLSPNYDFQTEACSTAYHHLTMDLIAKLLHITSTHSPLLTPPHGIGMAVSPNAVKLLRSADIINPITLFEARFSMLGGNAAANQTWSGILTDAINQIGKSLSASFPDGHTISPTPWLPNQSTLNPNNEGVTAHTTHHHHHYESSNAPQVSAMAIGQHQQHHQTFITIFSTDMNLLGDQQIHTGSIKEGLKSFYQRCQELKRLLPGLRLRIVCVHVSGSLLDSYHHPLGADSGSIYNPTTNRYHDHNSFLLHTELVVASSLNSNSMNSEDSKGVDSNCGRGWIEVIHIHPTVMIYEEELKTLLGMIIPHVCTSLELPSLGGFQCEIRVELRGHSLRCLDCISYMRSLEVCSITTRHGIDPKYIVGYGFEVTYPNEELFGNMTGLHTPQLRLTNRLNLDAFKIWLARKDAILIVRVPYTIEDYPEQCSKYWALVPPPAGCVSDSSDEDKVNAMICNSSMTLVMLADRDECIIPFTPSTTPASLSLNDAILKANRDRMISFFESSIDSACGKESPYNPWTFVGGQINAQFAKSRFLSGAHHGPTMPSTAPTMYSSINIVKGGRKSKKDSTSVPNITTNVPQNTGPNVINLAEDVETEFHSGVSKAVSLSNTIRTGQGGGRGRNVRSRRGGEINERGGSGTSGGANSEIHPEHFAAPITASVSVPVPIPPPTPEPMPPPAPQYAPKRVPLFSAVPLPEACSAPIEQFPPRPKLFRRKFQFKWGQNNVPSSRNNWEYDEDEQP